MMLIHLLYPTSFPMPLRREAILQAHLLGIHTLFADHSLIGFEDVASILTIKLLVETLAHVVAATCIATGCVNLTTR